VEGKDGSLFSGISSAITKTNNEILPFLSPFSMPRYEVMTFGYEEIVQNCRPCSFFSVYILAV
jgi:hypothetical protein